jgi:uncharacterized membrane protein YbhN (UPF0104 family)
VNGKNDGVVVPGLTDAIDPVHDLGPGAQDLPKDRPHGIFRRILSGVLSYGFVLLVIWFLVQKLSSPDKFSTALESITWQQVVVVSLLGLVNLFSNLPPMVVTLPGLRYREGAVTNSASAAVSNTVPEGGAVATGLNFAMLRSWGFRLQDITSSFLTTGIWTNLVRYSLAAGALVFLVARGTVDSSLLWVTALVVALVVAALVLFGLMLRSEPFSLRLGRIVDWLLGPIRRHVKALPIPSMVEVVPDFRTELVARVRGCWRSLTIAMTASQLMTCFVLGIALRLQGVPAAEVGWAKVIVAFGAMSLASLVAPTPGGLGVAGATLVAVLSAGVDQALQPQIVAAVLLFRFATWFLPIPLGLVSYIYWRISTSWRAPRDSKGVRRPAAA